MPTERSTFLEKPRHPMADVIDQVEYQEKLNHKDHYFRNYDFSLTIPKKLRNRVVQIIRYEYDEFDQNVFIDESDQDIKAILDSSEDSNEDEEKKLKKQKNVIEFNESTCSEIERLQNEHREVHDLQIGVNDVDSKDILAKGWPSKNWCSKYVCKPRKERITWDSKIYDMTTGIFEKTLDEQAQDLQDATAECFVDWLNGLGSNKAGDNLTKEKIKALFSIEGDRRLFASIQTEPKEVKAIAKTIADEWNMPHMALELKYEKYIKRRLKEIPRTITKVAFGATVPGKDLPWLPGESDVLITTVFPNEILSQRKLFKGIGHLRSTQALLKFFRERPHLEKPSYLVAAGLFDKKIKQETVTDVPLYDLLKLQY